MDTDDRERKRLASEKYRLSHLEITRERSRLSQKKRRMEKHDEVLKLDRKFRAKVRLDVLTHYSGGTPICACCGDTHIEFLAVDHIFGGGTRNGKLGIERRGLGRYIQLRRGGYPKGYRVLCHNCNQSLGLYGYCPHGGLDV
jgi:hypothetical protein